MALETINAIDRFQAALARSWTPTPHLTVSEIARKHLILSPEYSRISGPVNLDLTPYVIEPMDRLTPDDPCRVVVFQGPVQGGKTIIGQAFLVSRIGFYPGPFLWVTSHDTKAEEFSKNRLDLMIRDSDLLRSKVADDKSRDKNNTIKLKRFPGGTVKLVGAQSVSGLTSDTIKDAMIDEADDHRENVSGAGSSIELAMNRQTTFGDTAKTLIVSSPKTTEGSEIDRWRRRGTDRRFLVACPECGHRQEMQPCDDELRNWRLKWTKGDYSDVHYECCECGASWRSVQKMSILASGRWSEPTNPAADPSIESYWINFMYLPPGSYSWEDFARQWDAAVDALHTGDLDPMRTLVNTRLARTFQDRGDSFDAHALSKHVEPSWEDVPDRVQLVTMATDVQERDGGRLETMWIGWGVGDEAWLLDYVVTPGDLSLAETWRAHDELRRRRFVREDGAELCARLCFVDRGTQASTVLAYTTPRRRHGIFAIKGAAGSPTDAIITSVARRSQVRSLKNAPYYTVMTIPAKDVAAGMLRSDEPGPRFLHIPARVVEKIPNLLDMLAAERRLKRRGNDGKTRVAWEKKSDAAPNEAWDLLVYNIAARTFAGLSGFKLIESSPASDAAKSMPTDDQISAKIDKLFHPVQSGTTRPPVKRRPQKSGWSTGGW